MAFKKTRIEFFIVTFLHFALDMNTGASCTNFSMRFDAEKMYLPKCSYSISFTIDSKRQSSYTYLFYLPIYCKSKILRKLYEQFSSEKYVLYFHMLWSILNLPGSHNTDNRAGFQIRSCIRILNSKFGSRVVDSMAKGEISFFVFYYIFWRAGEQWPLFRLCCPNTFFEECLHSNPESITLSRKIAD